ncbi:MAG: hypothetical protein KDC83_03870 [Flavobacteriales bacterium]|nr:hypothetical protein [Flavobacteriales bacterium]
MKNLLYFFVVLVSFSSCKGLKNASSFEEDDVYFTNHSIHRINRGTISFNENIAVPEGSVAYFDESYATTTRSSYSKKIDKFDKPTETKYFEEDEQLEPTNFSQPKTGLVSNIGFGMGVAVASYGGGSSPYYNPYNQYYPASAYPTRNNSGRYTSAEAKSTRPLSGYSSRSPKSPSSNNEIAKPRTPTVFSNLNTFIEPASNSGKTNVPDIKLNQNPGYKSTNTTKYRTRETNSGYTSPSMNGGSTRPSGGYHQGGTIRGAYRR